MKTPNQTVDELYEEMVKANGLYGKAFLLEKTTRQEKKKLNSLHKQAIRIVAEKKKIRKQIEKKIARPTIGAIPQPLGPELILPKATGNVFNESEPEV